MSSIPPNRTPPKVLSLERVEARLLLLESDIGRLRCALRTFIRSLEDRIRDLERIATAGYPPNGYFSQADLRRIAAILIEINKQPTPPTVDDSDHRDYREPHDGRE